MSQNLQYPSNPDTSLESFLITVPSVQVINFSRTISQAECVPLNYTKVALAVLNDPNVMSPIRELIYIDDGDNYYAGSTINDLLAGGVQSSALNAALSKAFIYWEDELVNPAKFGIAMGVVTEINVTPQNIPFAAQLCSYQLIVKLKINWLVLQNSMFS
jgi:hypothetical protein